MKATAYAVLHIDITTTPPSVAFVGIYGDATPTTMLSRYRQTTLFRVDGTSFHEVSKIADEWLALDEYNWCGELTRTNGRSWRGWKRP